MGRQVFQIKTKPEEIERIAEFLTPDENSYGFVAIGWPGIGNLSGCDREEIRLRLGREYNYSNTRKLGYDLGVVDAFVNVMNEDDIILVRDGETVWVGTLGTYHFDPDMDHRGGMPHQRKVQWVTSVPRRDLDPKIQQFVANRNTLSQFPYSIEESGLDPLIVSGAGLSQVSGGWRSSGNFDAEVVERARGIVEEYLSSADPVLRFQAAKTILELTNRR